MADQTRELERLKVDRDPDKDAGLTFRPLSDTITALLEQFDSLPEDKRTEVMTRIPVPGEAEMIEAAKRRQE